ncbi:unnamed protein product [Nippostrongylus brasiliensis]|uniref:Resolvase/invertase-type recombinase catalytic domain-containing protein n=1 Tax=Nippostrongylus brasiliensis TaxID=27835 RepID=A0A0N4Y517_NIPBR|nr:unnamed protein product [Nippostrongylus brasiliensis]
MKKTLGYYTNEGQETAGLRTELDLGVVRSEEERKRCQTTRELLDIAGVPLSSEDRGLKPTGKLRKFSILIPWELKVPDNL